MEPKDNPKYEKISDLAGPDKKKHARIKREAQRAGAYARFDDDDYVDREAVLAYQMKKEQLAREARDERKASRENSSNRYGHIDSLRRIDVFIKKISSAIDERTPKLESILDNINSGVDQAKRDDLSDDWDRLSLANQKSEAKLKDALARRKEIETEQQARIEVALNARSHTVSPVDTREKTEEEGQ
jgi:hypothetical protein